MDAKVLIVTDYAGNLHIAQPRNKGYYQSRNQVVKEKQYRFREGYSEAEAEKFLKDNNGKDPDFITAKKAVIMIAEKSAENDELKAKIAELEAKLAGDGGKDSSKKTVQDIVIEVNLAETVDAVKTLADGVTAKKVIDAATARIAELEAKLADKQAEQN
jgi:BMFP domain-containing protein YqiC